MLFKCLYVLSSVLGYPLRFPYYNDVRFGFTSSCIIYVICVSLHIVVFNICCVVFCFVFRHLVYPMLPVSLDFPFLIVPSWLFSLTFMYHSKQYSLLILPRQSLGRLFFPRRHLRVTKKSCVYLKRLEVHDGRPGIWLSETF